MIVPPGGGREFSLGADRFYRKGEPGERSDAFSVVEYVGAAGVPGPPLHIHRAFEEAWFILEGEVSFRAAGATTHAARGAYILVPRGVPHTFQVLGTAPARWVGIFSPARYVGLVEELGALMPAKGPPDPVQVERLFSRYETDLCPESPAP